MTQSSLPKDDEVRLIISSGLIAVAVGVFTILPSNIVLNVVKITFGFGAFLSFFYILLTAAKLKYREPGSIDFYTFTDNFRQGTYDLSINVFGPNLSVITMYCISLALGWNPNTPPDWRLAIGFIVTFPIMLALLGVFKRRKK